MDRLNQLEFHPELRIEKTLTATQVLGKVFNGDEVEQMNSVLTELGNLGPVLASGRGVREAIGCVTHDISKDVTGDLRNMSGSDLARIQPIVAQLANYPGERKVKPDADFITDGVDLSLVAEAAIKNGLETRMFTGTGDIPVVEIKGRYGAATMVDINQTWHKADWWPKYDVKAKQEIIDGKPVYKLDCAWDSMYTYPLEVPALYYMDYKDPKKIVVAGRSFLWQQLSTDPNGNKLKEPSTNTQNGVIDMVAHFSELLRILESHPEMIKQYESGVRDLSLALRTVVFKPNLSNYERNVVAEFVGRK